MLRLYHLRRHPLIQFHINIPLQQVVARLHQPFLQYTIHHQQQQLFHLVVVEVNFKLGYHQDQNSTTSQQQRQ